MKKRYFADLTEVEKREHVDLGMTALTQTTILNDINAHQLLLIWHIVTILLKQHFKKDYDQEFQATLDFIQDELKKGNVKISVFDLQNYTH